MISPIKVSEKRMHQKAVPLLNRKLAVRRLARNSVYLTLKALMEFYFLAFLIQKTLSQKSDKNANYFGKR